MKEYLSIPIGLEQFNPDLYNEIILSEKSLNESFKKTMKDLQEKIDGEKNAMKAFFESEREKNSSNFYYEIVSSVKTTDDHFGSYKKGDITYKAIRKYACDVPEGDEEFYKDRNYCEFKIVNNVLISLNGGYTIGNGILLTQDEVHEIKSGIFPEILIN